jgi:shikimate dehydrogenase
VQATPLGAGGEQVLAGRALRGRVVLDAVYSPRPTPLVVAARRMGLAVVDGLELLVAQAVLQFRAMTGHAAEPAVLRRAAERWLDAASSGARA